MARIILPNQLFDKEYNDEVYLLEHPRYFTDFDFHKKKLVMHRGSMKAFEESRNIDEYIEFSGDLEKPFREHDEVKVFRPEDRKLRNWLQEKAKENNCVIEFEESPMFLTSMEWNREYFSDHKYFQLNYYKEQRKRLDVLMEDGEPVGGKWSFDPENREKMPESHEKPEIPSYGSAFVEEAETYVEENFPDNPGKLKRFSYPVTREQAMDNLDEFLENRMENFGKYQDAIDSDLDFGYHSLISSSMNIGLLTPQEVVEKTLEKHSEKNYPLNSLEGFLRQIIGWREFVRALYHLEPEMKQNNFFNCENKVSDAFYKGSTDLLPVDTAVERVNEHAYTHHIERLMVFGNVMNLLEIDPDEVYDWFMEMFIDSYDWVMTPNIYGMSQYAWPEMMTKPYLSSSNYIGKMSNYSGGEWENDWDALYWNFIYQHREKIEDIPRMSFMTSHLDRMNQETIDDYVERAEKVKKRTGVKNSPD